jgi:hypothetical protein
MKRVALVLLVLALTVPAMAAVNITISKGAGADANKVTIGYNVTASEEVRAFALNIAVTKKAFVVGTPAPVGDPNFIDYWVYPGSITFTVADGNTVVDNYGTPVAEQDPNGGVLEMASLYAGADPNHPVKPADSNTLCSFRVKCAGSGLGPTTVTLSLNTKRGGVVLKDPNVIPTVNLPAAFVVCCNYPACWDFLTQCHGSTDGAGKVSTGDFGALKASWNQSIGSATYNPCADVDRSGKVGTADFGILKSYWNVIPPSNCTTGDINHKYCP